jgi:hypothetical protein
MAQNFLGRCAPAYIALAVAYARTAHALRASLPIPVAHISETSPRYLVGDVVKRSLLRACPRLRDVGLLFLPWFFMSDGKERDYH